MSDLNLSSFYPVDEFALIYGQAMDPDSAPSHFLGDVSISFDSTFSLGLEPIGDYPMDFQESAGLVPHDTKEETLQPIGILAPLVADYVLANPNKPFDGEVSTQDTYLKDVKRYMDKHGKAPHCSAFVREDFSFQCVSIITHLRIRCLCFYVYFWLLDVAAFVPSQPASIPIFQLLLFENELLLFPNVQSRLFRVH